MQQVAVAVFHIDEIGSGFAGDAGRAHIIEDEVIHLAVGQHLRVAGDIELPVEERVAKGDARFPFF